MTAHRLKVWERELLRQEAMANWHRTEELMLVTEETLSSSERLSESFAALMVHSHTRGPIASNVDRAIDGWVAQLPDAPLDEAVALVASANHDERLRIRHALLCDFHTVGASDAGTALGLSIAAQPDIAVIDADLDDGSGVDTALALPVYAPHTRVLVLTDNEERRGYLKIAGLDVEHRQASEAALLAWAEGKAA